MEDLSGLEPTDEQWMPRDRVPDTVRDLFAEVGRVYMPFLVANAAALDAGAARVECTVDGRAWVQRPFPYQGKCLQSLRESYRRLRTTDRHAVDTVLDDTVTVALREKQP